MKATFNVPDDLYREVKARSAMEGRTVKDVVITLFRDWLRDNASDQSQQKKTDWSSFTPPLAHLIKSNGHAPNMEEMREQIVESFDESV